MTANELRLAIDSILNEVSHDAEVVVNIDGKFVEAKELSFKDSQRIVIEINRKHWWSNLKPIEVKK